MLMNFITYPVDELYLNILNDGNVSRIGVLNGVVVEEEFAPGKLLVPKSHVRILANLINTPLILSAGDTYGIPVEVAPFPFLPKGVNSIRDVVVKSRNWHRGMPDHYPLRYRVQSDQDLYSFGLAYNFVTKKLDVAPHKFTANDLDFKVNEKYIEGALEHHVMSDLFTNEHVADFCASIIDPRLHMWVGGAFGYNKVPQLLGFGSFELACQLTRKFIDLHGSDPLPSDGAAMRKLFQKVTGRTEALVGHPTQILGARVLHNILTTPLDNLGVNLKNVGTKLARDAEVVRQRLHYLLNTWLQRLYKEDWTPDQYDPKVFDAADQEEEEEVD